MSNITPGPWTLHHKTVYETWITGVTRLGRRVVVAMVNAIGASGEDVANARAIATVPDMINALHEISLCSQNSTSSKEECGRIARAALTKIKGEPT